MKQFPFNELIKISTLFPYFISLRTMSSLQTNLLPEKRSVSKMTKNIILPCGSIFVVIFEGDCVY